MSSLFERKQIQSRENQQKKATGDGERPKTFSFTKDLPKPNDPSFNGINPWSLMLNVLDTVDYTKGMLVQGTLADGRSTTMGDKYFVASGTCDSSKSVKACRGKTRYMYIDNVPSRVMPCANPDMPSDPKCQSNPTGLIAGVVQDVVKLNPFELSASIQGKGSYVNDKCVRRTERVGYQRGDTWAYRYETKCAPPRKPLVCSLELSDGPKCVIYKMDDKTHPFVNTFKQMVKASQEYAIQNYTDITFEGDSATAPNGITATQSSPPADATQQGTSNTQKTIKTPKAIKLLPLDPYERVWTRFCTKELNTQLGILYNIKMGQRKQFATTEHCLMDRIQCEGPWVLYKWYSLVKVGTGRGRRESKYFQIFFHAYLHPTKKYNNYWLDDASEVTGILDTYGKLFSEARKRPQFSANVEFEGFVSDNSLSKQHATADGELWQRVLLCMIVLLVGLRAIVRRCFKDCF